MALYSNNIIKYIVISLLVFISSHTFAQNNSLNVIVGHNTAFKSSIKNISSNNIYTYDKNNNGKYNLINMPSYNLGINYERKINSKFSIFLGLQIARTETELTFENFNNPIDDNSYVRYGYGINTYEIPVGIVHYYNIKDKILLKNYLGITYNLNGLTSASTSYRLKANQSATDTSRLSFTETEGFPSGNSFGIRYGIGIAPFKKFSNWEIGIYYNYQFKHTLTWDQEVLFVNVSNNINEYHQAIIKDKTDYMSIHLKYRFLKI